RYTRLSALFDQFCTCFNDADAVIVANVYAAGEAPIAGADRDALVAGLRARGHRNVMALEDSQALAGMIKGIAAPGDYVVCLGAPAQALFMPEDEDDLAYLLAGLPREIPVTVIGLGSNLIVRDGGVAGIVIRLGRGFNQIDCEEGNRVRAGTAAPDQRVARAT